MRVDDHPGVQTGIVPDEWSRATKLVKSDARWQAAMRLRGIERFEPIFCDALSVGSFGARETRRLLKVPCYDARGTRNVYGRPIEGVMGLVDLDRNSVVEIRDSGVVPVSKADPSLEQERQPRPSPGGRPTFQALRRGSLHASGQFGPWEGGRSLELRSNGSGPDCLDSALR